MRRIFFIVLTASLLATSDPLLPAAPPDPVAAPGGPVAIAPAPHPRNPITSFEGVVTAVDAESITVRGFGASVCGAKRSGSNFTGSEQWAVGPKMTARIVDFAHLAAVGPNGQEGTGPAPRRFFLIGRL